MGAKVALTAAFIISLAILGVPARSLGADSAKSTPAPEPIESDDNNKNSSGILEFQSPNKNPALTYNFEVATTGNRTDAPESSDTNGEVDARSAYINNQYVPDEQIEVSPSPPLYELLQQQMEQVLAVTGPMDSSYGKKEEAFQEQPYDIVHGSVMDYEEETQPDQGNQYDYNERPTVELPKPMYRAKPTQPPSYLHQRRYANRNKPSKDFYQKPIIPATGNFYQPTRRIIYETVSTTAQFVSTPLADLMVKFTVSIAKPPNLSERDGAIRQYNPKTRKT